MTDDQTPEDEISDDAGDATTEPDRTEEEPTAKLREPSPQRQQRSPVGAIVITLVVLAIAGIGIWAWMGMAEAGPRELVQQVVEDYSGAENVHSKSTMTLEISMGGQNQTMEVPTEAWFSQPNRLKLQSGTEMQRTTAISDGDNLYVQLSMLPGAVKLSAPKSFAEMPLDEVLMGAGMLGAISVPDTRSLVSGSFDASAFETISEGITAEDEWYSSIDAPENARGLTLKTKDGPTLVVWIDRGSKTVRKFATTVDYETLIAGDEEMAKAVEQMPEQMRNAYKQMQTRVTGTVETIELGASPPEGAFTFEPEEGTEVVEADSIREGMRSLMASAQGDGPQTPEETDLTGKQPPAFTAQDLDGNEVEITNFKGEPVVLDFWATWCAPCLEEMPLLNELYGQYKDQGLQIVAVSSDQSIEDVKGFLEENEIDFTVLWMPPEKAQSVSEAYGITGIPRTLYIDGDWTVQVDDTGLHEKSHMVESLGKIGIQTGG